MALTITNAGSATSILSVASVDVLLVTASVNDMLIVTVANSNGGTDGASSLVSVTDSTGVNSYDFRAHVNFDPGAVNTGTTLGGFTCLVTAAMVAGTVTVNLSPNTPQTAVVVYRVQPTAGYYPEYLTVGAGTTGTGSSPTITSSSITSGYTIVGMFAAEYDSAFTGDADSSNGSWSSAYTAVANGGAGANYQCVITQCKTVTGTGTQTYNPTMGASRDYAGNWISIKETVLPSTFEAFRRQRNTIATGVVG